MKKAMCIMTIFTFFALLGCSSGEVEKVAGDSPVSEVCNSGEFDRSMTLVDALDDCDFIESYEWKILNDNDGIEKTLLTINLDVEGLKDKHPQINSTISTMEIGFLFEYAIDIERMLRILPYTSINGGKKENEVGPLLFCAIANNDFSILLPKEAEPKKGPSQTPPASTAAPAPAQPSKAALLKRVNELMEPYFASLPNGKIHTYYYKSNDMNAELVIINDKKMHFAFGMSMNPSTYSTCDVEGKLVESNGKMVFDSIPGSSFDFSEDYRTLKLYVGSGYCGAGAYISGKYEHALSAECSSSGFCN
ncbi:hypothetical protein [Pseudodesulfovibrio piezophilus]|uniref:Lipoprotein n=1 Tax=Pseudodesulfovibrio piezophilus (strain DSM 21447 / JCM 15486 / C1TLV30) TaxID=1322246 RepID=M1WX28_PSEP2|nr:hypothetical protein [Pseudodesulfovibrio piezophilus]CCH49478.1 exported protein of unknown function [Pseudodesulfovibrio piezophilus C1TLV30]